jgi:hypothetical protein
MARTAKRSPGGLAATLLTILFLVMGVLVGTGTATAAPPDGGRGGATQAYTGELTLEQLALVLDSGVDRREVLTVPGGAAGSVRVEVVLGTRVWSSRR